MRQVIIAGLATIAGALASGPVVHAQQVTLHESYFRAQCSYNPDHGSAAIVRLPCKEAWLGVGDGPDIGVTFVAPDGSKVTFLGRGDLEKNDGVFSVSTVEREGHSIIAKGECKIRHTKKTMTGFECVANADLILYIGDAKILPAKDGRKRR